MENIMRNRTVLGFCGILSLTALALVAGCSLTKPKTSDEFAAYAAQHCLAGIEMGRLGVQRGTDPSVKAVGTRWTTDYTEANMQLRAAADHLHISLPSAMNSEQLAMRDKLSALSGAEFDKAYMSYLIKDQESTIQEFQTHSEGGDKPVIKMFAARFLGALTADLQMARDAAAKVGAK